MLYARALETPKKSVDVWYWQTREVGESVRGAAEALLNDTEKARQKRLQLPSAKDEFCLSRYMLRTCLSTYCDVAATEWRFKDNVYGKPEISYPSLSEPLAFNLSHTLHGIALAVSSIDEVGIDLEHTERRASILEIAERFYSTREYNEIGMLPRDDGRRRFFEYWTLRESYVKARGLGAALLFAHLAFHIDRGGHVCLAPNPALNDDVSGWHFQLMSPEKRHVMALALRAKGRQPIVTTRHFNP
ncbi:MAG: 4'-phosphopantetheinyl transferase superfamily protein [Myxococcales bacterium]|nr:4'-phosphopantetheinyl transferase superfamily protein [Myxococcales bacterium]